MDQNLDGIIPFLQFLHRVRSIERKTLVVGKDRWENDSEHSYELALMSWYIIERDKLSLDTSLILKYALAHDVVEAYAGDIHAIDRTPEDEKNKRERENKARERIQNEFPEFKSLHEILIEYELQKTPEAEFVYALDKVLPFLNGYLDEGRAWKKFGITLEKIVEHKEKKVLVSGHIKKYFDQLLSLVKENKENLFQNSDSDS